MDTDTVIHPADPRTAARALLEAATTAGYAPSIHDCQPWRWRLTGDTADPGATTFEVTGDFRAADLVEELNCAGFSARVT